MASPSRMLLLLAAVLHMCAFSACQVGNETSTQSVYVCVPPLDCDSNGFVTTAGQNRNAPRAHNIFNCPDDKMMCVLLPPKEKENDQTDEDAGNDGATSNPLITTTRITTSTTRTTSTTTTPRSTTATPGRISTTEPSESDKASCGWRMAAGPRNQIGDLTKKTEEAQPEEFPWTVIVQSILLVLHLLLQPALTQEIKLENLDNGPGVLPFRLGPANIISNYHSFLQIIDIHDLQDKISSISLQLNSIRPDLNNKTSSLFEPHINYLKEKLDILFEQLRTFEPNRIKRGLIDGLGSVVKSITGNLDYMDAIHYNNAIKSIQHKENELVAEFNHHVSLTKEWTSQYSKIVQSIANNQKSIDSLFDKIRQSVATNDNDLIKYAHLAQVFLILGDNIDSVSLEIGKLQNILAFIRTSTVHHSIITPTQIRQMISKLQELYSKDNVLDLDIREYYDVIKLGSYYAGNNIIIVFKLPIFLSQVYDLYKISMIPNKNHEILTSSSPFLAIHLKDFKYIEAECPKTSKGYLCEEIRNLRSKTSEDCLHQLIITQQRTSTCSPVRITMDHPAFEILDDKHYTVSFPHPTGVHLSCGQDLHQTLHGSYLIMIPQNCYVETPEFKLYNIKDRIRGQAVKIMDIPEEKRSLTSPEPSFKLNSINLDHLHEANCKISLQAPVAPLRDQDYVIYHTTIPMYLLLLSACALAIGVAYRKYYVKRLKSSEDNSQEIPAAIQGIYAVPDTSRLEMKHLPAQFTTKIFNSRCSAGGDVTQS